MDFQLLYILVNHICILVGYFESDHTELAPHSIKEHLKGYFLELYDTKLLLTMGIMKGSASYNFNPKQAQAIYQMAEKSRAEIVPNQTGKFIFEVSGKKFPLLIVNGLHLKKESKTKRDKNKT